MYYPGVFADLKGRVVQIASYKISHRDIKYSTGNIVNNIVSYVWGQMGTRFWQNLKEPYKNSIAKK